MKLHSFASYGREVVINTDAVTHLTADGDMTNIHFNGEYVKVDMRLHAVVRALNELSHDEPTPH